MSINVENMFVKCNDQALVVEIIHTYLRNLAQQPQPFWGLPSSFGSLLAHEHKRKLAISPPCCGWVALIESKEVVDFALADLLSRKLQTHVLIVQLSESSGAAGYAFATSGHLLESYFSEDDHDPLQTVRDVLIKHEIRMDFILFRNAVQCADRGWRIIQKQTGFKNTD
jgi:hypothetical protein